MLVNLFEQLLVLPAKKDGILLNALRARISHRQFCFLDRLASLLGELRREQ